MSNFFLKKKILLKNIIVDKAMLAVSRQQCGMVLLQQLLSVFPGMCFCIFRTLLLLPPFQFSTFPVCGILSLFLCSSLWRYVQESTPPIHLIMMSCSCNTRCFINTGISSIIQKLFNLLNTMFISLFSVDSNSSLVMQQLIVINQLVIHSMNILHLFVQYC